MHVRCLLPFLQIQRLLRRLLRSVLPLVGDRRQTLLHSVIRATVPTLVDEVAAHHQRRLDAARERGQLRLERLVLGLDVGGLVVIRRDPVLDFVRVPRGLLRRLLVSQVGALVNQAILQVLHTLQYLLALVVDLLDGEAVLRRQLIRLQLQRGDLLLVLPDHRLHVVAL